MIKTINDMSAWRNSRFKVLSTPIDPLLESEILDLLSHSVENDIRINLCHANLHGLYCAEQSSDMSSLFLKDETFIHIDGTPIVWLANLAGRKISMNARNTHIDLLPQIIKMFAEKGWPMGFIGSRPEHVDDNYHALQSIESKGIYAVDHGYFGDAYGGKSEETRIIDKLNASDCKIVFVGMGMPKQEEWILANRQRLNSNIVMPVGGFIDYFAGRTQTPPRVLGRLGLEGLYRLVKDPARLWRRYLIEPIALLWIWGVKQRSR